MSSTSLLLVVVDVEDITSSCWLQNFKFPFMVVVLAGSALADFLRRHLFVSETVSFILSHRHQKSTSKKKL